MYFTVPGLLPDLRTCSVTIPVYGNADVMGSSMSCWPRIVFPSTGFALSHPVDRDFVSQPRRWTRYPGPTTPTLRLPAKSSGSQWSSLPAAQLPAGDALRDLQVPRPAFIHGPYGCTHVHGAGGGAPLARTRPLAVVFRF